MSTTSVHVLACTLAFAAISHGQLPAAPPKDTAILIQAGRPGKRTWTGLLPLGPRNGARAELFSRVDGIGVFPLGETEAAPRRRRSGPAAEPELSARPCPNGLEFRATKGAVGGVAYRVRYTVHFDTRVWRARRGGGQWVEGAPLSRAFDTLVILELPDVLERREAPAGEELVVRLPKTVSIRKAEPKAKRVQAKIDENEPTVRLHCEKSVSTELHIDYVVAEKTLKTRVPVRFLSPEEVAEREKDGSERSERVGDNPDERVRQESSDGVGLRRRPFR